MAVVAQSPVKRKIASTSSSAILEDSPKKQVRESLTSGTSDSKEIIDVGKEAALEALPKNESIVSAREVIDGMLEDASVMLKVFFVPSTVSRIPSNYSSGGTFDLFELSAGDGDKEYTVVAKNALADTALTAFEDFGDKVVLVKGMKYSDHDGKAQLELQADFEVLEQAEGYGKMRRQKLSRMQLSGLGSAKNRTRTNLLPVFVKEVSDSKEDKNGSAFRSGKLLDSLGCVCTFMVWGDLALEEEVWVKDTIINVMNVEVNTADKRLDFRAFSQVAKASKVESFARPRKLHMLVWK